MQLKEVEKLTGLSTKAIRLYEEKGLIQVSRNANNLYRHYTENHVNELRKIKVLRYFNFSLQEIKELLPLPAEELALALDEKIHNLEALADQQKDRLLVLRQLKKSVRNQEDWQTEYDQEVTYLESDDYKGWKAELDQELLPSFWLTLFQTLPLLGPILWLFIDIQQGRLERLPLLVVLSLGFTVWLTLQWQSYLVNWWRYREKVKQKNRKDKWLLVVAIVSFLLGMVYFIFLGYVQERWLLGEGWLFYESSTSTGKIMIFFVMAFIGLGLSRLVGYWKVPGWVLLGMFVGTIGASFFFMDSTVFVTKDRIEQVHLFGSNQTYTYDQVERVETGFGAGGWSLDEADKKGQFYYRIFLDGQAVTFVTPTHNTEFVADDTYIELEDFDQVLMDLAIPKTSSTKNSKDNQLDPIHQERFIRIIQNK